jgi:hypothetical protein
MEESMRLEPMRIARLENVERDAWRDLYGAVPAQVAAASGLASHNLGSGLVAICSSVDVLAFNRVIALGIDEPADPAQLDRAIELFRGASVGRFFVQVAPTAEPPELVEWLGERTMTHHNNWARLCRSTETPPEQRGTLRVEHVGIEEAEVFSAIIESAFGWPDAATHWVDASFGREGWHHYIAYDDDEPIATSVLYTNGDAGWLSFAATLSTHEGRGAQSALIARRISDAHDLGIDLLSVETAEDLPSKPSQSNRNLKRMGFELAYLRRNYLWKESA